ncbi:VanZ family protein [Paenibacillus arenilitoris]|uniref:VanZ family protein n=1 Tax=Paenibacillus arenilitoris TaxID=2772299 RepID=A0A927CTX0_9BACL|nr:VanZ family protein [Paenibacillus arenilitoris]MBD2871495.1 VanZ family protein [Paenibacillus arenilitoris]
MKQSKLGKPAPVYRKALRYLPALLWMSVIFLLSSRTGDEIDTMLPLFRKLFPFMDDFNWGHFVSYFVLAMTIDYAIGGSADKLGMKVFIVLLCGVYGVTDEYHQSFVGGRMLDPADLRNDMIGAALWTAVSAIPPVRRIWRKFAS